MCTLNPAPCPLYPIPVNSADNNAFRNRARYEADRYGWDPWVFVRELLQNSRDAGARGVWISATRREGRDRIECRDDGAGMGFEHARRYLFTLYASSKRGRSRTAGRFGIGFWSVLRFSPDTIVIRSSRDDSNEGWLVRLSGNLEHAVHEPTVMEPGTEIVLERPAQAVDLENAVRDAVLRDAPFLSCRDRPEQPLEVRVNGRIVRSEPELPPPSLSFRRRGLRGAVALGDEPRVEIFAHGLKVRDAASLDDLLLVGGAGRPPLPATTGGSAPRVRIDSRDLSVLMARGDAREDHALRRLVAIGHRELGRLVRAELDRHARATGRGGIGEWVRDLRAGFRLPRAAVVGVAVAVIAGLGWLALEPWPGSGGTPPVVQVVGVIPNRAEREPAPYHGLEKRYRGPSVEILGRVSPPVDLHYQPGDQDLYLAALLVTSLDADGVPTGSSSTATRSYRGQPCVERCVEIEMTVNAGEGVLGLPVPTGHVVDPDSVRLDGGRVPVVATASGQPAIRLGAARAGRLLYQSSAGPGSVTTAGGDWPDLPAELHVLVADLEKLARVDRVSVAADYVRRRVRYDRSLATSTSLLEARRRGLDLFSRTLAVGAGDCDVQNALLAGILDHVGVPSRLALGWVGS
ncbi:MAG: ATP-binding protein, partial [Acidobacteria bacterium]|nr:ATP-binding protein [Candidatus Sulfomarinibacter sp. MAG AM1]